MGDNALIYGTIFFLFCVVVGFISPLISLKFVNKSIEKRYKCKLDLENPNAVRIFLFDYFKLSLPTVSIGTAYIFNKNRFIEINPGLKAINYNIKTATKQEIFVSCLMTITFYLMAFTVLIIYIISKLK